LPFSIDKFGRNLILDRWASLPSFPSRFELREKEICKNTADISDLILATFENKKCPHRDPYLKVMEILSSCVENLNKCDKKVKLERINIG